MSRSSAGPSRRYSGTGTNPLDRVDADTRFPVSAVSTGSIPEPPGGMLPSSREAWARWMKRSPRSGALVSRPSEITLGSHRLNQYDPERLDQRAPSIPIVRWDLHAAQSTDAYRLEHLSTPVSLPNRARLTSPDPCRASYLPRACLGHDPGRLLAQVGDRLQDVPATLAFELVDPAHPIVDGVLDERVRAADGAHGFGRDHARSIDVPRSSAHRPFG